MTMRDIVDLERRGAGGGLLTRSGLELRDMPDGEIRDVDDKNHTVQVAFPHERVDSFRTVFGKDTFVDSFKKRLPTMCWQHDVRDPIGQAVSAQSTSRANEIRGRFDDFDVVPNAKRAFSQIQSGTLSDFSFGFKGAKFQPAPEHGKGVRRIARAFMAEFSPVTIGSIPGAGVTALRAWADLMVEPDEDLDHLAWLAKMNPDGPIAQRRRRRLSGSSLLDLRSDQAEWPNSGRGSLTWSGDGTGANATCTGPMGHKGTVITAHDGGVVWAIDDPTDTLVHHGTAASLTDAKAQVAALMPGAH
jgi:HK97 family phage prohead protease